MTQLETLKVWLPDAAARYGDALLISALERAKLGILELRFPFGYDDTQEVEPQYQGLQIEWAIELINRMGTEGETAHSEGGVSRSFESADVSKSLKRRVVPVGKVIVLDDEEDTE